MSSNMRSNLFYLKQYGFSSSLLETIYHYGLNPIELIFNKETARKYGLVLSKSDAILSQNYSLFKAFKTKLFNDNDFLQDKKRSKIYFKFDDNEVTSLVPKKVMPLFMYSKGDPALLSLEQKRVAVIGTRTPSQHAIIMTKKLTRKFVEDEYIIVSGLARGVDTISHIEAIASNGKTIAVLPTNFNKIYPANNIELTNIIAHEGLLLTSIGPNENTYKSSFLDRNKYVANISNIILVIETNLNSGTMNTIRNASEANKQILFINQHNDDINNKLFNFGGRMIDD